MVEPFGTGVPTFADPVEDENLEEAVAALERDLAPPGSSRSFLTPEDEEELANQIDEMLAAYDATMKARWDREKVIEECYHLVPQKEWGGDYEEASELVSETIMAGVDQAVSRLGGQFLSVRPLVAFEGIESRLPPADSTRIAELLQDWMDRYLRYKVRVEKTLPVHLYPAVRSGTAVVYAYWDEGKQMVTWKPIQSRDAVLWPPWNPDWQDAEWAGHKSILTISQFKTFAHSIELSGDVLEEIIGQGGESHPQEATATFDTLQSEKIKPEGMTSSEKGGVVGIYELWGNLALPGKPLPSKFRLYFHRDTKKILWAELNQTRTKRHPYNPLRYKMTGASAWGMGLGQELLPFQAQDSVYMNLETDTLRASCFGVYLVSRGSIANAMFEQPVPGQIIPTEDPSGDFRHESLADAEPLQMLNIARSSNEQRKMNASGMAAVLQGQGDPTMKSSSSTGAVMSLIEQAGKKFGQIDRNIRNDFADLCLHSLEMSVQFSEAACFPELLAPEDAEELVQLVTTNLADRPYSEILRVSIQAPSAQNNDEMRRERLLVVYNMIQQHATMMLQQFATPILMATNPAAVVSYQAAWTSLLEIFGEKVLESHEIPGLKGKIPKIDEFIQPDVMQAQVNVLLQTLQQKEQELAMLQQALMQNPPGSGSGGQDGVGSTVPRPSGPGGVS